MSYSDLYLQRTSKPPWQLIVVAVIAVLGIIGVTVSKNIQSTRASSHTLVSHTVVNIGVSQAGVFYQTDNPVESWILYGTDIDNLNRVGLSEHDTENRKNATFLHYI